MNSGHGQSDNLGGADAPEMTMTFDLAEAPIAFWLVALIALLMALNAIRAFASPIAFAAYLGLPLADSKDADLVRVYGLRAAFLGVFAAILLARQDFQVLKWYALAAAIMPVGDAILTIRAAAPERTIARHVGIAIYLLVTFSFLSRTA
jgi:hypothetical protein